MTYISKNPNGGSPRFGFIVAKKVGNAVVRNTVRRRLKALCYAVVTGELVPGADLSGVDMVFRALPPAADASFEDLKPEVVRAVSKAVAT